MTGDPIETGGRFDKLGLEMVQTGAAVQRQGE